MAEDLGNPNKQANHADSQADVRDRIEHIKKNPLGAIPLEPTWETGKQGSWSFEDIGEGFDEHVRRHVPGYDQIEQLVVSTAMWNCYHGARVLDVGCSTGLTLSLLATRCQHPFEAIGIDIVEDMIAKAEERFAIRRKDLAAQDKTIEFIEASILDLPSVLGFEPDGFDVIMALFALQFISTPDRLVALERIAGMLRPGGLFVLVEKTMGECAQGADLFNGIYSDWKLQSGVTPDDILAKWSSLRGRLIAWPALDYERWGDRQGFARQLIWCWGPFRAWAFWKPTD